jgi:hypothetical protein
MELVIERPDTFLALTATQEPVRARTPGDPENTDTLPIDPPPYRQSPRFRFSPILDTKPITDAEVRDAFLRGIYELASESRIDKAISLIFRHVDSMLRRGGDGFDYVDKLLGSVAISRLQPDLLLAFLAITFAAKAHLNPVLRSAFVFLSRKKMLETIQDENYVDELLQRYA